MSPSLVQLSVQCFENIDICKCYRMLKSWNRWFIPVV